MPEKMNPQVIAWMEAEVSPSEALDVLSRAIDMEVEDGCTPETCDPLYIAMLGLKCALRCAELERVLANLHAGASSGGSCDDSGEG